MITEEIEFEGNNYHDGYFNGVIKGASVSLYTQYTWLIVLQLLLLLLGKQSILDETLFVLIALTGCLVSTLYAWHYSKTHLTAKNTKRVLILEPECKCYQESA